MSEFSMNFSMGIEHILNVGALDHISFIAALCLRYVIDDWKKMLILVTAFTIGHSITLALSTLSIINVPQHLTEFFIAVTIVITAFSNCFVKDFKFKSKYPVIYFFALFFGLIHGLGFSSVLKNMYGVNNILVPLLAFNLGLEVGQIIIVAGILIISFILITMFRINRKYYLLFVSGGIAALALEMALQRIP